MLEEFPKKISRDPILTDEQRVKMTRENHEKSAPKKKPAPKKPKVNPAEELKRAKKERNAQSAANRQRAESKRNAKKAQSAAKNDHSETMEIQLPASKNGQAKQKTISAYTVSRSTAVTTQPTAKLYVKETPRKVRGGRFDNSVKSHGYRYGGRPASMPKAIILGICAMGLVGAVIYGRVQTNEIYSQISKAQAKYKDCCAKNVSMRSEMEGKMTVKNVAEYAEKVLELKQLDPESQIQYIQLQTEDDVVIAEADEGFFVKIRGQLIHFWEFIKGE